MNLGGKLEIYVPIFLLPVKPSCDRSAWFCFYFCFAKSTVGLLCDGKIKLKSIVHGSMYPPVWNSLLHQWLISVRHKSSKRGLLWLVSVIGREEPHGCGYAKHTRKEGIKMSHSKIKKKMAEFDRTWGNTTLVGQRLFSSAGQRSFQRKNGVWGMFFMI